MNYPKLSIVMIALVATGAISAVVKTQNQLSDLNVNDIKTTGAKGAVKAHGRIHEICDALRKCKACPDALQLCSKASDLSAASARIAVEASAAKETGWKDYKATKAKHKKNQ